MNTIGTHIRKVLKPLEDTGKFKILGITPNSIHYQLETSTGVRDVTFEGHLTLEFSLLDIITNTDILDLYLTLGPIEHAETSTDELVEEEDEHSVESKQDLRNLLYLRELSVRIGTLQKQLNEQKQQIAAERQDHRSQLDRSFQVYALSIGGFLFIILTLIVTYTTWGLGSQADKIEARMEKQLLNDPIDKKIDNSLKNCSIEKGLTADKYILKCKH